MEERRPTIWFLRTPDEHDAYEASFSEQGFVVRSLPMLRFEPLRREELIDRLSQAARYGGIIITSPRAAEVLVGAMADMDEAKANLWFSRPVFVVGPRTATILRDAGFEPVGEESGTGADLAAYIASNYVADLPLLFLAGDRRRDELPLALDRSGLAVDEVIVYRTRLEGSPPATEVPDWVVAFSPSGVESWMQNEPPQGVRYAAIGPTTAEALRAAGLQVDAVADHPSPDSLLFAIMRSERGQL